MTMDRTPHSLASPTKPSALPRPSKLPRPQSVAIYNDVPLPVTPQRAPLQKIQRPQPRQPPWPPTQDNANGRPKGTRHLSQQENPAPVGLQETAEEEVFVQPEGKHFRGPRPSLSDRAIETISQIPPSPATNRRRSSFFSPQSPMAPRPQSAFADRSRPTGAQSGRMSPTKRTIHRASFVNAPNASVKTPPRSVSYEANSQNFQSAPRPPPARSGSPTKPIARVLPTSASSGVSGTSSKRLSKVIAKPGKAVGSFSAPAETMIVSKPRERLAQTTNLDIHGGSEVHKFAKSSAALREQIARAKAAHTAAMVNGQSLSASVGNPEHLHEDHNDPFKQGVNKDDNLLLHRINSARLEGYLNISSMGLKALPNDVLRMYDADVMEAARVPWSRAVDLVRANIADNEIGEISNEFFSQETTPSADDVVLRIGPFCGVESLDLHGNILSNIPICFGQLERLTFLNLCRNKLDNSVFEILCNLQNIRELNLAENDLTRELPQSLSSLRSLEHLDLHGNKIAALPRCIRELVHLRVINISNNRLSSLPMDVLATLPLRQIIASTNALTGALFDSTINSLPLLEILDVSGNSIASLSFNNSLDLPALIKLNASQNRLTLMPNISSWKNLISLFLDGNGLTSLPIGFTTLTALKTANLTGNSLTTIDEGVAKMTSLNTLALSGNPLREKKFLSMSTDDIKTDLQKRMNLKNYGGEIGEDASWIAEWGMSSSGILDLSSHLLEDLDLTEVEEFVAREESPRSLVLAQNKLTTLPVISLSVFKNTLTVLDVSRNALSELYITGPLLLPFLRELNLSGNKITSFDCLQAHLTAPSLAQLDVSRNRFSGSLPHLREAFGKLTQLIADDNAISEASADALFGMEVVSLRGNDLTALDPEIGLLGEVGLRSLEVRANKFRVPNHIVLNKGTQAVLEWLRMKIPQSV